MGNILFYKTVIIAKLLTGMEKRFRFRFTSDAKNIYDAIEHLDQIVFNNYVRCQAAKIHEITRHGILFAGIEWHNIKKLLGKLLRRVGYEWLTVFQMFAHIVIKFSSPL